MRFQSLSGPSSPKICMLLKRIAAELNVNKNHRRLMCPSMIEGEVGFNSRTELVLFHVRTLSSSDVLARHVLLQLEATCTKYS